MSKRSPEPLLALPRGDDALNVYGFTVAFMIFFLALYGGASFVSGFVPWRIHVDFPFEASIPFVPAASMVYLTMNLLVGLAPFVLRTADRMWPMFASLCAQTAAAVVVFVLLPVETSFAVRVVEGTHAAAFSLADFLNMERNFLPSLHVGYAVTAALAYSEGRGSVVRLPLLAWAAAIGASTMLIHEHHLLDVIAGAALAVVSFRWIGAWARQPRVLHMLRVDLLCLHNSVAFARRHRRYGFIAAALAWQCLPRWRSRRVLRTGFCFLQAVDDVLDGDRTAVSEPLELVDEWLAQIRTGHFDDSDMSQLAAAFCEDMKEAGGKAAIEMAIELIEVMQKDRRRVLERRLLTADELLAQHRKTFRHSVDLMLIGGGMDARSKDVPALIDGFGWCSTVRDLDDDLGHGLCNIPRNVVLEACGGGNESGLGDGAEAVISTALLETEPVKRWLKDEHARAVVTLDEADREVAALGDRSGHKVLRMFARSIRSYVDHRLARRFPHLAARAL